MKKYLNMLKTLSMSFLFLGSPLFAASYTQVTEEFSPEPPQGPFGQFYGGAVVIGDDVAVVGAPFGFSPFFGRPPKDGAAYVYVKTNGTWVLQQKLVASDGNAQNTGAGNEFGFALAMAGDTIAVGAPTRRNGDKTGAVYVFKRSNTDTGWTEQAIITSSTPRPFGLSVALRGGTLVAGGLEDRLSSGGTSDAGLAFVFVRNGDDWIEQGNLMSDDVPPSNNRYGVSVDIRGNTVVVGAQNGGAVYVFSRRGHDWTQEAKITSENNSQSFGQSVSLSGASLAVGDPGAGAVSVYEQNGQDWQLLQTIAGTPGTQFGCSVAERKTACPIGAQAATVGGVQSGAAYLYGFDEDTGTWTLTQTLSPADGQAIDNYGVAVNLGSTAAIVGATRPPNPQSGAAYIYEP